MRRTIKDEAAYVEEYNENLQAIYDELNTVNTALQALGNNIATWFNQNTNEKTRIKNEVNNLSGELATLRFALTDDTTNATVFTEEFNNYDNIDLDLSSTNMANISTAEGMMTLARDTTSSVQANVSIKNISGNGEAGNTHVLASQDGSYYFISSTDKHNSSNTIIDGETTTWMEYQLVNLTDDAKKTIKYDYEWCKGAKTGQILQQKILLALDKLAYINYIGITPYIPTLSGSVIVASIRTSANGVDYYPIDSNNPTINIKINTTTVPANKSTVASAADAREKYKAQGAFFFDAREVRYIEIILLQDTSYTEKIGHISYFSVSTDSKGKEQYTRIPSKDVPNNIKADSTAPGRYTYTTTISGTKKTVICQKTLEAFDGWRYCIGVRDISLYNYQYSKESQIITNLFETTRPIKKIAIQSEEIIPEKMSKIVGANYTNIQYYISIDDINWIELLPLQRQSAFSELPKFIEINKTSNDLIDINSTQVTTAKDITDVRVKVVLRAETGLLDLTPMVESYTLKLMH